MKHLITFFILITASLTASSQIFINEIMSLNQNGITDNTGVHEDWVEIYNSSSTAYNIGGLYISDNITSPLLYQIPLGNDSTIVPAGGYLLLWADDDVEQGVLHLGFKLTGDGEQLGLFDGMGNPVDTVTFGSLNSDISYGRSPNGTSNWVYYSEPTPEASNLTTFLSALEVNVNLPYLNNYNYNIGINSNTNWTVSFSSTWLEVSPLSGSNNGSLVLHTIQENTSGSAQTTIITLSGSGVNNQIISVTQYGNPTLPSIVINEFMADNSSTIADNNFEYDDWIEIYNKGNTAVNLAGLYITDNISDPLKYQISSLYPDSMIIQPGGFKLFWADNDENQGIFHIGFKLSNNGEYIGLYTNEFTVIDDLDFGAQDADISYGRSWDGGSPWELFTTPTPGYSNSMGIEDILTHGLIVYPNPAENFINIETQERYSDNILTLYNISGEIICSTVFIGSQYSLNTSLFTSGIYFVKVISDNKIFIDKIIIR